MNTDKTFKAQMGHIYAKQIFIVYLKIQVPEQTKIFYLVLICFVVISEYKDSTIRLQTYGKPYSKAQVRQSSR